jgi:hypothetical protein
MEEEVANLVGCPIATAMRKLKLLPQFRRPA